MTTSVLHRISFYSVVNGYYQHLELKQLCNRNIDHKHSSQTWLWRLWWSAFLVMSWCLSGEMQLWNSLLLLFSCDLTNMIIITSSYYNDHDQNPSSRPPWYWDHDDVCDKDIGKLFFSDGSVLAPCFEIHSHLSWNRSHELVLLASDGICHCNGCNERIAVISKEITAAFWTRFLAFVFCGFLHFVASRFLFSLCVEIQT